MTPDGLHTAIRGEGPGLVLSHGFASDSATWDGVIGPLATGHRVVSWDLRGHGRSPAPPGHYSREMGLADLAAVVELAAGGTGAPVLLVGHSLGGYLSLFHALTSPGSVSGLVLISTGPGFRNPDKRADYNRLMEKVAARRGVPLPVAEVVRQRDAVVMDSLPTIDCPTLVITGANDHEMYRAGSRYVAERLPRAELVEITGAGHDPHVDRADEVTALIRRLAGHATGFGTGQG